MNDPVSGRHRPKIALVNPNTSDATTAAMVEIAAEAVPEADIIGVTAPFGASMITDEVQLARGAEAVVSLDPAVFDSCAGVIVAAFGDPGLEGLREKLSFPVTGIAEAGMATAAQGGRRFSVVTTTPDLVEAIERRAARYGLGAQLVSVRLTEGPLAETMADPALLVERLGAAIEKAVAEDGAEAIVIGGGPLAVAARTLASRVTVPLIEPVPEAARKLLTLL